MRFSPAAALSLSLVVPAVARAQTPAAPQPPMPQITLPTVTVTAQKEPADSQTLPVSVTAVPVDPLWNGGAETIGDLSIAAPNTYFTDFSARKLSNARFRGIGSSPSNPSVTTFIDGVPQLNTNSASIELLDVSQVEFVRGPQSTLYGRNTLGGAAVNDEMDGERPRPIRQLQRVRPQRRRVGTARRQSGGWLRYRPRAT
jgi:outer membrane receptor protein involved in Fe transport